MASTEPNDERTRLIDAPPSAPTPDNATAPGSDDVYGHARNVLLSTTLSRLGSRSWEFASPLLLLEWSPGSLAAPAAFGLANALFRTLVSPWLGARADGWDRFRTVLVGTAMQGLGCFVSVGALVLYTALSSTMDHIHLLSLTLVIMAGVIEALGAQLSYVAVKKEWVPIIFDEENNKDNQRIDGLVIPETGRNKLFSFLCLDLDYPVINLTFINTAMTNIDLLAAMFGPILAGWLLQAMEGGGDAAYSSTELGFVLIAFLNILSFVPEALLLRRVYRSCPALRQRRGGIGDGSSSSPAQGEGDNLGNKPSNSEAPEATKPTPNEDKRNPWSVWFHHPSGLPLLTVSIASLYLTALSPAGVVLTAYLVTIGLSPRAIGAFRAAGALSGVAGISLFSLARNWGTGDAAPSSSAGSIEQLRRVSLAFIAMEVASVLVAAAAFSRYEALAATGDPAGASALPWQILLFLGAICVSRAGLYSFDIGALEIEQYIVDERYRNAVGSVEGALCSSAEMCIYLLSIVLPDPAQFGWQVGVSAAAVSCGGACFGAFVVFYLLHGHHHGDEEGQDMGHSHTHQHSHTFQQERDLQENHGFHIHLHRHDSATC